MTVDEALGKLREHWGGRLFVEEQSAVTTISNRSREARATPPPPGQPMPKIFEAPTLFLAVMTAVHAEGLDQ